MPIKTLKSAKLVRTPSVNDNFSANKPTSIPEDNRPEFNQQADRLIEQVKMYLQRTRGKEYSIDEVRRIAVKTVEDRV